MPALTVLPCLGLPKTGRIPGNGCVHRLPCVEREKTTQEGTAYLPISAKSPAGARRLHPTFSSDMAGSVRQVDFSRPARYFGHFTWKTGWKL